jgi:hypothetical protein
MLHNNSFSIKYHSDGKINDLRGNTIVKQTSVVNIITQKQIFKSIQYY